MCVCDVFVHVPVYDRLGQLSILSCHKGLPSSESGAVSPAPGVVMAMRSLQDTGCAHGLRTHRGLGSNDAKKIGDVSPNDQPQSSYRKHDPCRDGFPPQTIIFRYYNDATKLKRTKFLSESEFKLNSNECLITKEDQEVFQMAYFVLSSQYNTGNKMVMGVI